MIKAICKLKNKKGFTLVELLVVLAVLAIIAAIAVPKFAGVQTSAKTNADNESLKLIQSAVDLYMATNGSAPSTVQALVDANYLKDLPEVQSDSTKEFKIDSNGVVSIGAK